MQKQQYLKIKGMNRDLSVSVPNTEFAYENMNIRLTASDGNTLLDIVNEKGNKKITIDGLENKLEGVAVGYAVLNQYIVIFTAPDDPELGSDMIYRIEYDGGTFKGTVLYDGSVKGALNFGQSLDTLAIYENDSIQKVYWVDGVNRPRVINIVAPEEQKAKWDSNYFDFTSVLTLNESVSIDRIDETNGEFDPGVIQYAFTYVNLYGKESSIFYTSPLYYTAFSERGGSPQEKVNCSFNIKAENLQNTFDYVRIYSIFRSSINATPVVKNIIDLKIPERGSNKMSRYEYKNSHSQAWDLGIILYETSGVSAVLNNYTQYYSNGVYTIPSSRFDMILLSNEGRITEFTSAIVISYDENSNVVTIETEGSSLFTFSSKSTRSIQYIDTGVTGSVEDPTKLLYIGGDDIIADTITQKDNTLFLGNIQNKRTQVSEEIKDIFKGGTIQYVTDDKKVQTEPIQSAEYYKYNNHLNSNSENIKYFKSGETYRFGIQFQDNTGKWSDPVWINDVKNTEEVKTPDINSDDFDASKPIEINLPYAKCIVDNLDTVSKLTSANYVKVRPVVVYPTLNDRSVLCQGVLCPTVYNVKDRYDNAPFVQSSWFTRPEPAYDDLLESIYIAPSGPVKIKALFNSADVHYPAETPPHTYNVTAADTAIGEITGTIKFSTRFSHEDGAILKMTAPYKATKNIVADRKIITVSGGAHTEITAEIPIEWDRMGDWEDLQDSNIHDSINSKAGIFNSGSNIFGFNYKDGTRGLTPTGDAIPIPDVKPLVAMGTWGEFRHNHLIATHEVVNWRSSEIQSAPIVKATEEGDSKFFPYTEVDEASISDWVDDHASEYYIDQSIVTLHSPDIEFDESLQNINMGNVRLNIKGIVPLTSFYGDIDIQTTTPPVQNEQGNIAPGFYKEQIATQNLSRYGWRGIIGGLFWMDYDKKGATKYSPFLVSAFNRNGPLNNLDNKTDGVDSAGILKYKKISNLRYSAGTIFNQRGENGLLPSYDISTPAIFNSNEVTPIKIDAPENSGQTDSILYYGNIDKVLSSKNPYTIYSGTVPASGDDTTSISNKYLDYNIYKLNAEKSDPISIRYKSSPHVVCVLNYVKDNSGKYFQNTLPVIANDGNPNPSRLTSYLNKYIKFIEGNNTTPSKYEYQDITDLGNPFWRRDLFWNGVVDSSITPASVYYPFSSPPKYGYLWLGELYRPEVYNRFGGETEEAFQNNKWVPCGEAVTIETGKPLTIYWTEGDTYYQRYDHLKTYPWSLEEQNGITDIISFMCETRVNIDGRYDRNRGKLTNFTTLPSNFNLINKVYSQENNFFTYNYLSSDILNITNYKNGIVWSNTKSLGELVDSWTKINLASYMDLDGDKGEVTALRRWNNNILAFQPKGISQILYNENVQISSEQGIPIEIANSGKVQGKRYYSTSVGCDNRSTICEGSSGLYFIDGLNKDIFTIGESLTNLSEKLGMHSWIDLQNTKAMTSQYDKQNGDVLFITPTECLAYSERVGQFTSFYNYEGIPYFINVEDKTLSVKPNDVENCSLWEQCAGDYNMFYDKYKPFYTTSIINPDPTIDKVFNTLEFRADTFDKSDTLLNSTFDTLNTWNEYQNGQSNLSFIKGIPSSLKKKFRIWRANIPRDNSNKRDRMRNPWLYLKLAMNKENTNKTILHDIVVNYFE